MAKSSAKMEFKPTLEQVRIRQEAVRKSLNDRRDVNKNVMVHLDQWIQLNFRSEGKKVGGWAPLAAGGRWKTSVSGGRSFDPDAKILQDTGRLRGSFVPFQRGHKVGIGSDVPYAKKHEEGLENLPVRRMLPKRSEVLPAIRKIFDKFVGERVRRTKLR